MDIAPRFVTTKDGTRIAYDEGGAGPPLIHVRGWISHLETFWNDPPFRAFMEALGRRYRVVRYDARGNGLSEDPGRILSIEAMVQDLEALVEHLALENVTLYATAFGGPIAALFAAEHPGVVDRIILSGTFARGAEITSRARGRLLTAALRFFPEMGFLLLGHATHPEGLRGSYRRPERVHTMISPARAADLYKLAFRLDVSAALRRIEAPTLVLHRRDSQSIPLRLGREVADLIPEARLVVLDGSAHNDWEGDAASALDAMSSFLGVPLALPPEVVGGKAVGEGALPGRYTIMDVIAEGPNSSVFRARDTRLDRAVVLKRLPPSLRDDPRALARFQRETRAVASLNHRNICTIHDVEVVDGALCMVMEDLVGDSLAGIVAKGPVPLPALLACAIDICSGLDVAHRHGIVHRDIKPSNLFVTREGDTKILDFGIAKPALDGASKILTKSGVVIGTPAYMSPEQALGNPVDARTDLFSLGIVMFEMAVGRRPFEGATPPVVLARIITQEPTPLREIDPSLPRRFALIVRKALEKDPGQRYLSAGELRGELSGLRRKVAR